ncbi:hypothetical protein [Amycolatopsis alkalitolerans]|uniref:hypothetical protein n=1 Tax=Amycolatopsis alkalitolerans TaxID=2547244 RepID=UPI00135C75F4|nr:hypothetical protein [Amycolatopsis alkalitolerans]
MREPDPRPGLRVASAIAVVLVLYSYLGALWLNRHGYSPATLVAIRDWLNKPSGISQDFGVLGVAVLLLVAGFRVAQGIPVRRMLVVTVPVLVVAVLVGGAARLLGGEPYAGLLWPLAVAALGTLLALATRRLHPVAGTAVQLVVIGDLVLFGADGPAALHEAGLLAGFSTLFVLGEVIGYVRAHRLPALAGGALGAIAFGVLIMTDHGYAEWHGYWYPVTALYAVLIGLLSAPSGQVAGETALVRWLASRALWLIGAACAAGWTVLGLGYQRIPLPVSLVLAVLVTGALAEAGYRFVQRPLGDAR